MSETLYIPIQFENAIFNIGATRGSIGEKTKYTLSELNRYYARNRFNQYVAECIVKVALDEKYKDKYDADKLSFIIIDLNYINYAAINTLGDQHIVIKKNTQVNSWIEDLFSRLERIYLLCADATGHPDMSVFTNLIDNELYANLLSSRLAQGWLQKSSTDDKKQLTKLSLSEYLSRVKKDSENKVTTTCAKDLFVYFVSQCLDVLVQELNEDSTPSDIDRIDNFIHDMQYVVDRIGENNQQIVIYEMDPQPHIIFDKLANLFTICNNVTLDEVDTSIFTKLFADPQHGESLRARLEKIKKNYKAEV